MPNTPMTSVIEIKRYITTKAHGFEVWRGMAEAPDRDSLRACVEQIRELGVRCRMATIPDSGMFGYDERYAVIMPDKWAVGLPAQKADQVWTLLEKLEKW
jgi:hypothetical protein